VPAMPGVPAESGERHIAILRDCLVFGHHWYSIRDGDPRARAMLDRHYSARRYKDGRRPRKLVGPGEYIMLMTADSSALFVWRKFHSDNGQEGVNCAVFRNERCPVLSSQLIEEACELAWQRWPGERLYTYVNPKRIKSPNPGYCFKQAGWTVCGKTKGGLVILERRPKERTITVGKPGTGERLYADR